MSNLAPMIEVLHGLGSDPMAKRHFSMSRVSNGTQSATSDYQALKEKLLQQVSW